MGQQAESWKAKRAATDRLAFFARNWVLPSLGGLGELVNCKLGL